MKLKKFWMVLILLTIGFSITILFINVQIPKEKKVSMKLFYYDAGWVEVEDLIDAFPPTQTRLNTIGMLTIVLIDFEGGEFAAWEARNFTDMKLEDDASNVLFRGYLIDKSFESEKLILTIAGLAVILEWTPFANNYVLEQGKVTTAPATSIITLEDLDGNPFTWPNNYWNSGEQNKGLLIVDNSHSTLSKTWDASDETVAGGTFLTGDYTDTLAKNDGANYLRYREEDNDFDAVITLDIDGVGIPDTSFLQKIEIDYQFGFLLDINEDGWIDAIIKLQIKRGAEWDTLRTLRINRAGVGAWRYWTDSPSITLEGTHEVLETYFDKIGSDYSSLKGLRFICTGYKDSDNNYVYWEVDYFKATVHYNTANISPIMKKIHDSQDSWIQCVDITNWQNAGVAAADAFKIGENTDVILADLAASMGIEIISLTTLSKYMARWFKGTNGLEVLTSICLLEGVHWYEDYANNRIVLAATADFASSGVSITSANYGADWKYEDQCNNYFRVEVYGCVSYSVIKNNFEKIPVDSLFLKWIKKLGIEDQNIKVFQRKEFTAVGMGYIPKDDVWIIDIGARLKNHHVIHKMGYLWVYKKFNIINIVKKNIAINSEKRDFKVKYPFSLVFDAIIYRNLFNMNKEFLNTFINEYLEVFQTSFYKGFPKVYPTLFKVCSYIEQYLMYNYLYPKSVVKANSNNILYELLARQKEIIETSDEFDKKVFRNINKVLRKFDKIKDAGTLTEIKDYTIELFEKLPYWDREYLIEQFSLLYGN